MGNNVSQKISHDGNHLHVDKEKLEDLQKAMQELQERRDDVVKRVFIEEDKGLQRLAQVRGWFSRVEGIESQVNELIEARSIETKRLGRDDKEKVLDKLTEIEELLAEGVFEVVAEKIPPSKVEKKHIGINIGLDRRIEKAWNSLMDGERRILALYGMRGSGKTTLLAHINNKFLEVVNEFDVVIWAVVPKDLEYEGIQDQILRRLGLDEEWGQQAEEGKSYKIYGILSRKKFVLLLDDLCSKIDLTKAGVPPVTRQNGSKIVFTTSSKEVCKDMEVDEEMEVCLSRDEARELFQRKVGKFTLSRHPNIPGLARVVADSCFGLPVALDVVGSAMAQKEAVHEWSHAITALDFPSQDFLHSTVGMILPHLKFGYDSLRDEKVKLCFLYCSLFPGNYQIGKNELIEYWIGEGFIDRNRDDGGDNKQGHDIIGLLVRAHLLIEGPTTVHMYDVVREMALWVASNFGKEEKILCVKSGVRLNQIPEDINWEVVRRMSLMRNQITEIPCSFKSPNLSTLILRKNNLMDISGEFFRFMPALVVLDLSHNKMLIQLPEEILNLGSLQYLNLSSTGIKSLPVGLKELRRLVVLNLEYTNGLQSICEIVCNLPNLQVLKLFCSGVCVDEKLMEELQLLEHLQIFTATIGDAMILESIQGVDRLASRTQALCLRNMSAPLVILNTVALGGLQRLTIWASKISEIKIEWERKERGELPRTSSPSFKHLFIVNIFQLEGPKDLTWLLFAQNLKYLYLKQSSSIEEIIDTEKGKSISFVHPGVIGKLEHLEVSGMDELKIICRKARAFPNLRRFIVQGCPKLPPSFRDVRMYNGGKDLK